MPQEQLHTQLRGRTYPFVLIAGPGTFTGGEFIRDGHQDDTTFDEAVIDYLNSAHPGEPVVAEWVEHEYAIRTGPHPHDISWEGITAETEDSFPITRLSIQVPDPVVRPRHGWR